MKSYEIRAQLVAKIEALKLDYLDISKAGFSVVVNQLRILNPELNVMCAALNSKIIDGQLMPREEEDEEEEE